MGAHIPASQRAGWAGSPAQPGLYLAPDDECQQPLDAPPWEVPSVEYLEEPAVANVLEGLALVGENTCRVDLSFFWNLSEEVFRGGSRRPEQASEKPIIACRGGRRALAEVSIGLEDVGVTGAPPDSGLVGRQKRFHRGCDDGHETSGNQAP